MSTSDAPRAPFFRRFRAEDPAALSREIAADRARLAEARRSGDETAALDELAVG